MGESAPARHARWVGRPGPPGTLALMAQARTADAPAPGEGAPRRWAQAGSTFFALRPGAGRC